VRRREGVKAKGKLELIWVGKEERPRLEPRVLVEESAFSYGDPRSENMLIHGDNLLALKALEQDFAGKIKCIYIDPPYSPTIPAMRFSTMTTVWSTRSGSR
jgi:adenine-specific DNA-methyltransferase